MLRRVDPEWLDSLPADDRRALRSRRDLRRVNVLMGHPRLLSRALRSTPGGSQLVDLGSGDGTLLLTVAKRLGTRTPPIRALLVDRRPSLTSSTRAAFDKAGWCVDVVEQDVFDWLRRPAPASADVVIANLFLHHFHEPDLAGLLARAAEQTRRFVACEPHRSAAAVIGASLLGLLGCNDVTRHDARVSVRSGFRDRELSRLWPDDVGWHLTERRSGPFTQMFVADRAA